MKFPTETKWKTWFEENVSAGVRVVLKRGLRASEIPFHDLESTNDLICIAQKASANIESACDEWVEIADKSYGLTEVQRCIMIKSAQNCLLMFRGDIPSQG